MNLLMLFLVVLVTVGDLSARTYESIFSQWGRSLDEMYTDFDIFHRHMPTHEVSAPGFSLEKNDDNVVITIDTRKKVTADDIFITHKDNRIFVDIKGLDHTLKLDLKASKGALGISMCSQKSQEQTDEHRYSSYNGSSCMQQIMSVNVNLSAIKPEYSDTKLVLFIPLVQDTEAKKIPVLMKDSTPMQSEKKIDKKNKKFDEK